MRQPEITFDPTSNDARRERTERAVLARLAAIQAVGDADIVPPARPRPRRIALAVTGVLAAAALVLVVIRDPAPVVDPSPSAPSLVVTPVGGSSRFTVADAIVEAGGDTSVEVTREGAATVLVLGRGSIECDVTPRPGRPPFRVVAGETIVEVVGTRFTVARSKTDVRVDVTRGKVRVQSGPESRVLRAGDSWTVRALAAAEPPPTIVPDTAVDEQHPAEHPAVDEADIVLEPARPAVTPEPRRPSSRAAFAAAQRLEPKDPDAAARGYRSVAHGKDVWAALALYSLAELHAARDLRAALDDLDELARRFPQNANAEDAAWLRVDVLRKLGRLEDARRAAATYLRRFPSGTYVEAAARLATPTGP